MKNFHFKELSRETEGNVWDFFNRLPHTVKTRIIVVGLINVMVSNFSGNSVALKLLQKIFQNELQIVETQKPQKEELLK
jgi:hypothetical protein